MPQRFVFAIFAIFCGRNRVVDRLYVLLFLMIASAGNFVHSADGVALLASVEAFGQRRFSQLLPPPVDAVSKLDIILDRPDPETFFSRYVFALNRHSAKLMVSEQAIKLKDVIDEHSSIGKRWHDERNTLRCKFNEIMWRYAAATKMDAPNLENELKVWMRLRMEWTLQEHLAQHEFNTAVWKLLDPSQKAHVLSGDWKKYSKLDTGHTHGNFTDKIITRAIGKPDHSDAFYLAVVDWEKRREELHQALQAAENNSRRVGFAMDVNSAGLVQVSTEQANAAYAVLYLAEANAIRQIVQVAYSDPAERCYAEAKEAWGEASKRFLDGAAELILLIEK